MFGRMRRWLFGVWIARDDYKMRYEHQYEMKCNAQDELEKAEVARDRWEDDVRRYAENADFWRERAEALRTEHGGDDERDSELAMPELRD
jgi:hypothetical protein